ncbi:MULTISPECIES: ribosomal protein S18-alanine N-acetyltransferase [unclassified Anabaena]|uniref:ribosomal protein S18-alanine N-acetyltransferase n=1 Tax=unclassified Anabaena TaxID=2619674 RepID=UPI00082F3C1D|nr:MULTISPECIES: ribosomal protein S18-alanine N-acetyltransferase [unclassified Anabaena]
MVLFSNLKFKSLTLEDINAILELDQACFGGLWTMEGYQRELDSPNSDLLGIFSPNSSSKLLGMGCFWSILDEAHITIVAVHPQYQRRSLGQALLYFLLQTAGDRGLERATLEVRASNLAAISLYQKFGFKTAGRRRRYYQDNGEDALILWLSDLQAPSFAEKSQHWRSMINSHLEKSTWDLLI